MCSSRIRSTRRPTSLRHGEPGSGELNDVAHGRQPTKLLRHEPADRVVLPALRKRDPGLGSHLVRSQEARDRPAPVAASSQRRPVAVVLVRHLADKLLHQIFDGHDPGRPAELVDHDRHLQRHPLQDVQQRIQVKAFGDALGGHHHAADRRRIAQLLGDGDRMLDVDQADDVVGILSRRPSRAVPGDGKA